MTTHENPHYGLPTHQKSSIPRGELEQLANVREEKGYPRKGMPNFARGIGIEELMKKIALDARLRALTIASSKNVHLRDLKIRGDMKAFRKNGNGEEVHSLLLEDCEINPELTRKMEEYYKETPEGQECNFTFRLHIKDGRTNQKIGLDASVKKFAPLIYTD